MSIRKFRARMRVRKKSDAKRSERARRRKNFHVNESRDANHLPLIRSFLIDSGISRASRAPNCTKNCCGAFASHAIAVDEKIAAPARDFCSRAALAGKYHRCKKSLFYRAFCNVRGVRWRRCRASVLRNVASDARSIDGASHAPRAWRTHIVKWSQCFFHCSVVNGVQCVSIPGRTDATPAMLHG